MYDIALATLLSIPCYWHHSMYCCAQVTVLEPDLKKSSNVQYGTVALNQSNNLEWKLTIPPDTERHSWGTMHNYIKLVHY